MSNLLLVEDSFMNDVIILFQPYFLYRNLTYMMRKPKKHKTSRNYFRLDSLMSRMEEQTRQASLVNASFEYLTIKYLGFFNKEGKHIHLSQLCFQISILIIDLFLEATETVKIETLLLKICQKKRKENNCPVVTVSTKYSWTLFSNSTALCFFNFRELSVPFLHRVILQKIHRPKRPVLLYQQRRLAYQMGISWNLIIFCYVSVLWRLTVFWINQIQIWVSIDWNVNKSGTSRSFLIFVQMVLRLRNAKCLTA